MSNSIDIQVPDDLGTGRGPGSMWTWPDRIGPIGMPALLALVMVSYGFGSELALLLIEASGLQGVLFIPAGITVAFLLRIPRRHWWIVLLGAGLAEFVMDVGGGLTPSQALGFSVANMAEPLLGAAVVTATCGAVDLARRRQLLWFILGAVIVGPAVGAAIGAGADQLFGGDDWLTTFAQWWLGDALGVILVGSSILAWGSSPDRRSLRSAWGGLLIVGSVALTVVVFSWTDLPIVFSFLVGVVGAGVVFGIRAVAITALAIALTIAIQLTVEGETLIIGLSPASALVLIKMQMAVFTLAGLLVAAESNERELATSVAARAAIEAESLERERKQHHDLAIQLQMGMLPDRLVARPGLDIAARFEAASDILEVGGDWYDTIQLRDGRIGVVVGDVVGHGIDAMISMGRMRTALAALAIHNDNPSSLLTELDEFVGGPDGTGYATVFYAIVDLDRETVEYASAGHPPGLLVSPDGGTQWLDQGQTEPLLGELPIRHHASVQLERGSTLVVYTDGLVERRGESLERGLARLEKLISKLADRRPDEICDGLFESLASGPGQDDDVVVLALKNSMDPQEFYEVFPAVPEMMRTIRSSLRSWISRRGIPESVGEDLLLSVGEATANSARHAYLGALAGKVTVRITLTDDVLNVEISDNGRWRDRSDDHSAGLGSQIIASLTEDLRVEKTGRGTMVAFRLPVSPSKREDVPSPSRR
ncbi:MAG: SpoIIE family protein phosphatase [Acidimicrobiia bacterium]